MTPKYVHWPLGEPAPTLGPQSLPRHIEGVLNFDKHPAPWEFRWFPVTFVTVPEGKVLTQVDYELDGNVCVQTGVLVDYVPPVPPVPQEVTETQFIRACVRGQIITAAEGEAYLARGELPLIMSAVLDTLPEPVRTDARLKAIGSSSFSRSDDVFAALVASGQATDADIDGIFRLAATL